MDVKRAPFSVDLLMRGDHHKILRLRLDQIFDVQNGFRFVKSKDGCHCQEDCRAVFEMLHGSTSYVLP